MRRSPALLGLATSLAALLAAAIGPATAVAGTLSASPGATPPHVAATRPPSNCSGWWGVPDQRSNIQGRACITVIGAGDHRRIFVSGWVRNRANVPLEARARVDLYHVQGGVGRLVEVGDCRWTLRAGETRGCGGYARDPHLRPPFRANVDVYRYAHGDYDYKLIVSPTIH